MRRRKTCALQLNFPVSLTSTSCVLHPISFSFISLISGFKRESRFLSSWVKWSTRSVPISARFRAILALSCSICVRTLASSFSYKKRNNSHVKKIQPWIFQSTSRYTFFSRALDKDFFCLFASAMSRRICSSSDLWWARSASIFCCSVIFSVIFWSIS